MTACGCVCHHCGDIGLPVQTGKLIAINIGREKIVSSEGVEQPGYKSLLVPVAVAVALTDA